MSMTYESAGVIINWAGVNLSSGWSDGTFLTISPNSERVTYVAGADGTYTFNKMADKGATITLTLRDVSDTNKRIGLVAAAQDVIGNGLNIAPFTVIDSTGKSAHFVALNAVLTEIPEIEFGPESAERTWTWVCETYIMAEDPATITAQVQKFIKASEAQSIAEFNPDA